jgi:DNA-binding MarR family transcriptional regulator/N-acetylglutamate synthase-like GNAT family acetyltransferase
VEQEVATAQIGSRVAAVRSFNRFYTRLIGLLDDGYLDSSFSLTEVRVLYELAGRESITASELCGILGLDPGYLSRILAGFQRKRLIERRRSQVDGRQTILSLSKTGRQVFRPLDQRSHDQVSALLRPMAANDQRKLVEAMGVIEHLLGDSPSEARVPYILRPPGPGEMGWVVERHGALYAEEYGWDEHFEALVADIVAKYVQRYDPKKERCWIAERQGEPVGCVFLVKESETVGRLRLMLVEPSARGMGIGTRLLHECLTFARNAGYRKVVLWTNNVLLAARHIYEKGGFRLVNEEAHHSFGHDLVGETWEIDLSRQPAS